MSVRTARSSSGSSSSSASKARVTLGDAVPRAQVPSLFAGHDALVNNMRAGAPDKVVYEAAASCMPVLASNPVFDSFLDPEQRFASRRARRSWPTGSASSPRSTQPRGPTLGKRLRRARRGRPLGRVLGARGPRGSGDRCDDASRGTRPARAEGRRHLRLGGPPAPAPSRPPRAGLGRRVPHAPRGRAGCLGVRPRASGSRRPARRHPPARGCRPDRVRGGRGAAGAPPAARSCTRISSMPTSTGRSPARWPASRSASRPSTASTGSARVGSSASPTEPSPRSRTSTSRSRRASRATSPRSRASTRAASRSSTTESLRETAVAPYAGSEPRLLCVGRLIPVKGHLVLLRALAQARARVPELVLDVAGQGPLEPALKRMRASSGSGDAVRFLGFVSPVQAAIEDAAIVVVPSLGEGFGMVALEAMERSRPVVASAVGGLPEIVADGETGLVVAPGDAEAACRRDGPRSRPTSLVLRRWARRDGAARSSRSRRSARRRESRRSTCAASRAPPRRPPRSVPPYARPRTRPGRAARPAAPIAAARAGSSSKRGYRVRERRWVVRRHEQARLPVGDDLRDRADRGCDDRALAQHRLEQREAESLPARGMDDDVCAPEPPGDVSDPPGKADRVRDPATRRERRELAAERALAEHHELRVGMPFANERERLDRDVDALLPARAGRPRAARASRRAGRAHPAGPTARAARRARSGRPGASRRAGRRPRG